MSRTRMSLFDEVVSTARDAVEDGLRRFLPPPERTPTSILEPMAYSLLAGGKRIRPVLVLLACRASGGSDEEALPAACAVEMVHTYSLVHDDLPAMDDDDLRRGIPTNHVRFGEASAILAGDALLTQAFSLIARETPRVDRVPAIVATLADAAGPMGMVGGQALDLEAEASEASPDRVREIHRLKTAALFQASARMGAEASGAPSDLCDRMEAYGLDLGLAFQAIDDVLDEESSADVLGKTVGKDRRQAKLTSIAVHGLAGARSEAERYSRAAKGHLEGLDRAEPLVRLVDALIERVS